VDLLGRLIVIIQICFHINADASIYNCIDLLMLVSQWSGTSSSLSCYNLDDDAKLFLDSFQSPGFMESLLDVCMLVEFATMEVNR
jgi:hypothetical protein